MDPRAVDFVRAAGVVVDTSRGRVFVGADQAIGVLEAPRLSPVPNAGFSLLWFEGEVIAAVPFQSCVPDDPGAAAGEAVPAAGSSVDSATFASEAGAEAAAAAAGEAVPAAGSSVDSATFASEAGAEAAAAATSGAATSPAQVLASQVLVCELGGQRYALTGVQVLASGEFEPSANASELAETCGAVHFAGATVPRRHLVAPAFLDPPSEPASAPHIHDRMSVGGDCGPSGPEDAGTT